MRYLGGKSRIAKPIADIINKNLQNKNFASLFCGSCAIESLINSPYPILCNDINTYLIKMFIALQNGWMPPDSITKEEYFYIKEHPNENPALTAFVGFGCSFSGKWFGGYASDKQHTNYCAIAKRSILKISSHLDGAVFTSLDYRKIDLKENTVVYLDPPYQDTTVYNSIEKFDSKEFWDWTTEMSKHHLMFISEQQTPEGFVCVWEKPLRRMVDNIRSNTFFKTEKLFVASKWVDSIIK